jgi:hypothetical protein
MLPATRSTLPSDSFLNQVEDRLQVVSRAPGGEVQNEPVVGQLQELGEHVYGYVRA